MNQRFLNSSIKFIRGVQMVAVIIMIFVAYGFILPEIATVEREIEIDTSPEVVFRHYNDLGMHSRWSPWIMADNTRYSVSDPSQGIGAALIWADSESAFRAGSLEIISSVPYKIVSSRLQLGDNETGTSSVTIYNSADNTRCRVVWSIELNLDSTLQKYRGKFLDHLLGPDIEQGLVNLKYLAETGNVFPRNPE